MTADEAIAFLQRGAAAETKASELVQSWVNDGLPDDAKVDVISGVIEAFGTEPSAFQWLTRPHSLLQDKSPLQVIRAGQIERVRRLLARINYGGVL